MSLRLVIAILLFSTASFAQSTSEVQSNWNRIFAMHFTTAQLESTYENDSEIYAATNYYFKESFGFVLTGCETCPVNINDLINNKLFDAYEHESLRLEDISYSFEYKDYTITLFPKDVVYNQLEGLSPTELVSYVAPRDFPSFELTNDDAAEYLVYKDKVYAWAKDFPEAYRTMTNSENLLKISIRDFSVMNEERKLLVLNHSEGCLILD
jgi:hypothetical protein